MQLATLPFGRFRPSVPRIVVCKADDLIEGVDGWDKPPPPRPPPPPERKVTPPPGRTTEPYPSGMPARRTPSYGKLTRHDEPSPNTHHSRRAAYSPQPSRAGKMSRFDPPSERSVKAGRAVVNPGYAPAEDAPSSSEELLESVLLEPSTPWKPTPMTFKAMGEDGPPVPSDDFIEPTRTTLEQYPVVLSSVGLLLALNRGLNRVFDNASVQFPASIAGMVLIFWSLTAANLMPGQLGTQTARFFAPTLTFVARYMPIFFVAPLVALPLAMQGVALGVVLKLAGVLAVGWMATILLSAATVSAIRSFTRSELTFEESRRTAPKPLSPFAKWQHIAWSTLAVSSLALIYILGSENRKLGVLFTLSTTVNGYMIGAALPHAVRTFIHPLLVCALFASAACGVWGMLAGVGYEQALHFYLQSGGGWGAGNLLMAMLPVVVLCDGIRVFNQRAVVWRHFFEIAGTALVCATFSLYATAHACNALRLDPVFSRALLSRSITTPLAIPMANTLGASVSLTAAFVCVTGLIGAATGQLMLNALGIRDAIARGVAQAASSHGLGAASMAADEPEALPFSAVSIAAMGIVSNLLLSVPMVRTALLAIVG